MTRVVVPISLPKELARKIERRVKIGDYASKSEYIRKAVRESLAWESDIAKHEKRAIQAGLRDLKKDRISKAFSDAGETIKYLRGL